MLIFSGRLSAALPKSLQTGKRPRRVLKYGLAIKADLYHWLHIAAKISHCAPEDIVYLAMRDFRMSPNRANFCALVDQICDELT